jgi:hypothetical protein
MNYCVLWDPRGDNYSRNTNSKTIESKFVTGENTIGARNTFLRRRDVI